MWVHSPSRHRFSAQMRCFPCKLLYKASDVSFDWVLNRPPDILYFENGFRRRPKYQNINFGGLILGCIEANFCKKIGVFKLSPRSSSCTLFCRSQTSNFQQKKSKNFLKILQIWTIYWYFSKYWYFDISTISYILKTKKILFSTQDPE